MSQFQEFLESILENNIHWQELNDVIVRGSIPGSIGIEIKSELQEKTMRFLAHRILCENGAACGKCHSCRAWVEDDHPDLLIAGEPDAPASVDECRKKAGELSLSPVCAPVRLLVFYSPEKMSLGGVNSLLKITEEPPPKGHILYMMDRARILPTLRSRLWMISFHLEENAKPLQPPSSQEEWLQWLSENEKNDAQTWHSKAHAYAAWLCQAGDLNRAASLRQLAEAALSSHLSGAMWSGLLFLLLREEYPFENVFDDFRQAALPGLGRRRK